MFGIDTSVLVRFLVRDDAQQFEIAHKIVEREVLASRRVFVSQLVLQEMEWVLRSRYGFSKPQIQGGLFPACWTPWISSWKMRLPLSRRFSSGKTIPLGSRIA